MIINLPLRLSAMLDRVNSTDRREIESAIRAMISDAVRAGDCALATAMTSATGDTPYDCGIEAGVSRCREVMAHELGVDE